MAPNAPSLNGQPAGPPPCVRTHSLDKRIDNRHILRDITLGVSPGEFVAVLGPNGAGKSTLLRILATLTPPTGGRLELFGRPAHRQTPALRARLGMIGHQLMLYRDLSVRENLEFFGRLYGVKNRDRRAMELLEEVGLADRADDAVKRLSRGMAQRAAIARALMHDPELILADEPFTGLDAASARRLEECLDVLRTQGRTIILANHDIGQSLRLAGRIIVLRAGRIVTDAPATRLDAEQILAGSGAAP